MSPEKQRIAIAEACGWRCAASFKEAWACWARPGNDGHQIEWIPDYLNSSDAMAEALKGLTRHTEQRQFMHHLFKIVTGASAAHELYYDESFNIFTATAAQRAEAFLRTKGLWEDEA